MVAAVASLFVNHSWVSLDRFLGGGKLIRLAMANISARSNRVGLT